MQQIPLVILLLGVAYILGCVSTGYYLVRIRTGTDIRQRGSGNLGARNVGREVGSWAAAITLIGDALKGAVPVAVALYLELDSWAVMAVVMASVAGHIWPAQLGFRGGKGLATAMGAVLLIDFRLVLVALAIAVLGKLAVKSVTGGGLAGVALVPVAAIILGASVWEIGGLAILASVLLYAHRDNLRTLADGIRRGKARESNTVGVSQ
ncbi:MAG: glycerol-3-phosphate acyltransferase [Dehalococcoidia bacterium]|nr:glycerol-3-phosphate acyltransferase [Dehalococcoidia bacterium]